jgi:uncharacterized protein (TIGR03083 family)
VLICTRWSVTNLGEMAIDLGMSYRAARLRIGDLADDSLGDHPVPATPAWNMHDVVAHLCGVATDVASGNTEGAASSPWTAAQVERGRGKVVSDLIDEWAAGAPGFEAFLSSPDGSKASAAVVDVHAHETDMRVALGLEPVIPEELLAWAGHMFREVFDAQVVSVGLPPVTIGASDFEWFRGRLGRRTAAEVSAFSWSADPAPYLDTFFIFGPTDHPVGL